MGHYVLLVTIRPREENSLAVRRQVTEILEADDSFLEPSISRGLLFHDPICDWFVCGGCWSGYLIGQDGRSDNDLGEEYDAQQVTEEIYDQFLAPYEGEMLAYESGALAFVDLDQEEVNRDFIWDKAIVVIDFHR